MPNAVTAGNVLRTNGTERTRLVGWFALNNGVTPTNFYFPGGWATVTYETTGQHLLTFPTGLASPVYTAGGARRVVFVGAQLQLNGVHGNRAYVGDLITTIRVYTVNASDAAVDLSSGIVHVELELEEVT